MNPIYQRIIAIGIVCIPGALGVYGWTLMRDITFDYMAGQGFNWLVFTLGLLLFGFSLYFIGGFIFYRDKKKHKVQNRLLTEEEKKAKQASRQKHRFLEKV